MNTGIQMTSEETIIERNLRLFRETRYDELYELNKRFIYHQVRKYTNLINDIEELVCLGNLAFTKALKAYDETKEANFITYLSVLIKNEILMEHRKSHKCAETISYDDAICEDIHGNKLSFLDIIPCDANIEEDYLDKEAVEDILSIVDTKLKPIEKTVFMMYLDNKTQHEIAWATDRTQGAVSRILSRTIRIINRYLKQEHRTINQNLKQAQMPKGDIQVETELRELIIPQKEQVISPEVTKEEDPVKKAVIQDDKASTRQRKLLLRNFTFETDAFTYTINNEASNNLIIVPLISSETCLKLDKPTAQSLIADLAELRNYL